MFYLKYLTMQGYRIFKKRRLSQAYANAQTRLCFRCWRQSEKIGKFECSERFL